MFTFKPTSLTGMGLEEELAIQKYFELNQSANETGEDSLETNKLKTEVDNTTDAENTSPAEDTNKPDDAPTGDKPKEDDPDANIADLNLDDGLGSLDNLKDDPKDNPEDSKDDKTKDKKDGKEDDKKDDVAKEELSDAATKLIIKSKVADITGEISSVIANLKLVQNDCLKAESALKALKESKNKDIIQNTGGTITELADNVMANKHEISEILTDYKGQSDLTMWQLLDNLASVCAFNYANYVKLTTANVGCMSSQTKGGTDYTAHIVPVENGYGKYLNNDGFVSLPLPYNITMQYLERTLFIPKIGVVPSVMLKPVEVNSDTPYFICQSVALIDYLNNKLMDELVCSVQFLTDVSRTINNMCERSLNIEAYTGGYSELVKPALIFIKDYSVYMVSVINKFLEIYEMAFAANEIAE